MDQYILSLSYGKDSLACLGAIEQLRWPLDRIVHAEVWATDDIPADLPPMVEFKLKADEWIKEHFGIEVEHICATRERERETYEKCFYRRFQRGKKSGEIYGFPMQRGPWCNDRLKMAALDKVKNIGTGVIQYVGIASDEPGRIARHTKPGILLPLVELGWDEAYCRKWCVERDLLSPIYTTSARGGCWFCHNQGVEQLRLLRKNYPNLWDLLMKWDTDSPVTFHADGRTVQDFEKRFKNEDDGNVPSDRRFRWKMLEKIES